MNKQSAAERTVDSATQKKCAKITTKITANSEINAKTTTLGKTVYTGIVVHVIEDTSAH